MTMDHHRQSMRAYLEDCGAVTTIREPVDPAFEIAACLSHLDGGAPVLFENVTGHALRVTGNHVTTLDAVAHALGAERRTLQETLIYAIGAPVTPVVVAEGACQEIVTENPDLAELPIPQFFEHETGTYISAGAIVARDRASGRAYLSIARLKPLGGNRAFIGIAPNHHLAVLARAARDRGENLEIAVTIGNHPAVMIAACLYLGLGDDELAVAGGLFGTPVETVRCRTVDLLVPAPCEIVLEGVLDPDETVEEGPVSEFHGMYERYGPGYVVTFQAMTRRKDAIYQAVLPGYGGEHIYLGAVAIAAGLARSLKGAVPSLREVAVTPGGAGRLHAVVSLDRPRPGAARKAIFAVWGVVNLIKQVTVVEGEVDPWDAVAVEHAVANHMRPDRDLIVVPGVQADRSEPLEQGGMVAKLGIDATRHEGDRADWTPARPPSEVMERMGVLLKR
jgi:2,5-furandicarboxylate decarboxylase 1